MIQQLAEQLKNLSSDEMAELNSHLKTDSKLTLAGCPKGTIPDGMGGCITDPLPPDPTHP